MQSHVCLKKIFSRREDFCQKLQKGRTDIASEDVFFFQQQKPVDSSQVTMYPHLQCLLYNAMPEHRIPRLM